MQIPELLFLFDTIRLTGEIPVQSDGVLQKAGFNFFFFFKGGGAKGEFGNESFIVSKGDCFMISFLYNNRHIQYGDKCSVLPWAGANTIKESE